MIVTSTSIPDVLMIEPKVHGDARGFFFESYNAQVFSAATGITASFVQDNHSRSGKNILRGLHYQLARPQGKLVRVVRGAILDVAVDMRKSSIHFGQYVAVELNEQHHRQLWVPPGFAHGFLTLSDQADVLYKTTDYYAPDDEHCVLWNDPTLNIAWPLTDAPQLSARDSTGVPFAKAAYYP